MDSICSGKTRPCCPTSSTAERTLPMDFVVLRLNVLSGFYWYPLLVVLQVVSNIHLQHLAPKDSFFNPATDGKKRAFYVQVCSSSTLFLPGSEWAVGGLNPLINITLKIPLWNSHCYAFAVSFEASDFVPKKPLENSLFLKNTPENLCSKKMKDFGDFMLSQ